MASINLADLEEDDEYGKDEEADEEELALGRDDFSDDEISSGMSQTPASLPSEVTVRINIYLVNLTPLHFTFLSAESLACLYGMCILHHQIQ